MAIARATALLSVVVLAALGISACGEASDEDGVTETMSTYLSALASGDGTQACEQLTGPQARLMFEDALVQLPELQATSCADALSKMAGSLGADEKAALEDADVVNIEVDGKTSTAEIAGGTTTAHLEKSGDQWLISNGLGLGGG